METPNNSEAASKQSAAPPWKPPVAILLWLLVALCAVLVFRELPWSASGDYRDFNAYYRPAELLRHGINPYAGRSVWGDTPTWLLCMEPLTLLPPFTAYKLWCCINVLSLAVALLWLLRDCALPPADKWLVAALLILYPPIALNFWFGQSEVFLLLLLVWFIRELDRGRELSAGLVLAAASLLRAYPVGMIGYLAARRRWRAAAITILGCAAGMALTTALVGTEVVTTYIYRVIGPDPLNQPIGFLRHPNNLSLDWFVRFILLHGFGVAELSLFSSLLARVAEFAVAAYAFVATRRLESDTDWRGFSLWVVTISILSPIMWAQFMACFVIVYVALIKGRAGKRAVIAAVASYVILTALGNLHGYPLNQIPEYARSHFANDLRVLHVLPETVTLSLILMYLSCFWFVREPARAADA